MKKLVLILGILGCASSAFATAAMTYKSGETPPAGITFMPSKNVSLGYESGNLGGTDMVVFSIASKNSAGDRIFGATSSSSAVAQAVSSAGYVLEAGKNPTLPTTASDSTITGGVGNWSIL